MGLICSIFGHKWEYLDDTYASLRQCKRCGKEERLTFVEYPGVELWQPVQLKETRTPLEKETVMKFAYYGGSATYERLLLKEYGISWEEYEEWMKNGKQ